MADDDKGASGATGTAGAATGTEGEPNDSTASGGSGSKSVSYDTYQRTLAEAKKAKAKLKESEDRMAALENEKLGAEGKKDELIAKLTKEKSQIETTHKDTLNKFVFSSLDSQVREEALALGCVDLDAVSKLADLSDVEVDRTTFKADKAALKEVLADLKKSKPYLFNKAAPKINTKLPNGTPFKAVEGKPLAKMTKEELQIAIAKFR